MAQYFGPQPRATVNRTQVAAPQMPLRNTPLKINQLICKGRDIYSSSLDIAIAAPFAQSGEPMLFD